MTPQEFNQYCKELNSNHPDLIKKWENSHNLMDRAYVGIVKECAKGVEA